MPCMANLIGRSFIEIRPRTADSDDTQILPNPSSDCSHVKCYSLSGTTSFGQGSLLQVASSQAHIANNVAMAIHPEITPEERVEAWTVSQVADALGGASISSVPSPRQPRTVTIDIPLDEEAIRDDSPPRRTDAVHTVYKRREPIRRDSLKRRESLLKGKEGSRRRQRWENDRLLSNPYATPPLPSDWQVQPTYRVHRVPYFLAPLWDAGYEKQSTERKMRADAAKAPPKEHAAAAKVTQDLRAKLKRSKGAKGLLMDLEEEVRGFVSAWEEKARQLESEGLIEPDSEDEETEVVFIGRNGAMSDERKKEKEQEVLEKDKLIFQGLLDDHGSAFGRYLVHSIAAYVSTDRFLPLGSTSDKLCQYGLRTWSLTKGLERHAYVGLPLDPTTRRPSLTGRGLPRPLWAVV